MKINNNTWFYSNPNPLLRIILVYVKGDMLVLLPFCILLAAIGLFSLKLMLIGFGVYGLFRHLGEMIYWLLQQFCGGTYRPFDYGLKKVDTNGIYIIYQLTSLCTSVVYAVFVIYLLFF